MKTPHLERVIDDIIKELQFVRSKRNCVGGKTEIKTRRKEGCAVRCVCVLAIRFLLR